MKRLFSSCLAVLVLSAMIGFFPQRAEAQMSVGLKLFGGYGYLDGGDVNDGLKGGIFAWSKLFELLGGYSTSGEYEPFHYGLNAGGDIILYASPVFGIGFGAEYLESSSSTVVTVTKPGESGVMTEDPKVHAIPIKASVYVAVPMGSAMSLTLHGGAGYYLASFKSTWRVEQGADWLQTARDVEAKGIGFHGGVGLELHLTPSFSLVLEAAGRYAKIDGFEGQAVSSSAGIPEFTEEGTLYYYRVTAPIGTYGMLLIDDTAPAPSPVISDIREAILDFSGYTARAGIVLRF